MLPILEQHVIHMLYTPELDSSYIRPPLDADEALLSHDEPAFLYSAMTVMCTGDTTCTIIPAMAMNYRVWKPVEGARAYL